MKNTLLLITINLITGLLQVSFFPILFTPLPSPNLYLAFALSLFIADKARAAILSAFVGGVIIDMLGFSHIGMSSLILISILVFLHHTRRFIFRNTIIKAFVVIFSSFIYLVMSDIKNIHNFRAVAIACLFTFVFTLIFNLFLRRILNETNLS